MTYQIDSVDDWPSGDTRVFPFIVKDNDSSDEFFDITDADISWELADIVTSDTVIDDSDSTVTIVVNNASEGNFEVRVDKDATDGLDGDYREIITIVDSRGDKTTWAGRIEIDDLK